MIKFLDQYGFAMGLGGTFGVLMLAIIADKSQIFTDFGMWPLGIGVIYVLARVVYASYNRR